MQTADPSLFQWAPLEDQLDVASLLDLLGDVINEPVNTLQLQSRPVNNSNNNLLGRGAVNSRISKPCKRGPVSAAQQLKRLEDTLQALNLEAQEHLQTNVLLKERARMLELVIDVKELQASRVMQARRGQVPTTVFGQPFSPAQAPTKPSKPASTVEYYTKLCSSLAVRLAKVMPLLDSYPQLLQPQTHPYQHSDRIKSITRASSGGEGEEQHTVSQADLNPAAVNYQVGDVLQQAGIQLNATELSQLDILQGIMSDVEAAHNRGNYAVWLVPDFLLGVNSHINIISQHPDWDSLATSVTKSQFSLGPDDTLVPKIADEEHWNKVVPTMKVTEAQKLHAAALWDIVSSGIQAVLQQRAQLMQSLIQTGSQGCGLATASYRQLVAERSLQQSADMSSHVPGKAIDEPDNILAEMNKTLLKERCLYVLVSEVLTHFILSPVQCVLATVNSFPFFIDHLALLYTIASQFNPSAANLQELQALQAKYPAT